VGSQQDISLSTKEGRILIKADIHLEDEGKNKKKKKKATYIFEDFQKRREKSRQALDFRTDPMLVSASFSSSFSPASISSSARSTSLNNLSQG
jgi:hypothetical protein